MSIKRKINVHNDLDIVSTRMQAREMAKKMGFGTADQARISLAASELARVLSWNVGNEPDSGHGGEIILSDTNKNGHEGLQVMCLVKVEYTSPRDPENQAQEPSIPRRSLAGACQLADESLIEKQNNKQARVTLTKWLK